MTPDTPTPSEYHVPDLPVSWKDERVLLDVSFDMGYDKGRRDLVESVKKQMDEEVDALFKVAEFVLLDLEVNTSIKLTEARLKIIGYAPPQVEVVIFVEYGDYRSEKLREAYSRALEAEGREEMIRFRFLPEKESIDRDLIRAEGFRYRYVRRHEQPEA